MKIKMFFSFILLLFALSGCFTTKLAELPVEADITAFKPLKLEMSYDVYHIRIDLNRQTTTKSTTTTDDEGKTETTRETEDVPYHYLGVDLGNGIFLDARLNLSINIVKMLDLEKLDYFKVIRSTPGLFGPDKTIYEKNGNEVSIKKPSFLGSTSHVILNENGALIKGGFLEADQDIILKENEIIYDPHSVFGDWALTKIIKTPGGLKIPGFWNDFEMVLNDDGSVSLGNNLRIAHVGKKISIIFSGFFGYKKEYTLTRTINKLYFYDENLYGFYIEIYKDGAVINHGTHEVTLKIIKEL